MKVYALMQVYIWWYHEGVCIDAGLYMVAS